MQRKVLLYSTKLVAFYISFSAFMSMYSRLHIHVSCLLAVIFLLNPLKVHAVNGAGYAIASLHLSRLSQTQSAVATAARVFAA